MRTLLPLLLIISGCRDKTTTSDSSGDGGDTGWTSYETGIWNPDSGDTQVETGDSSADSGGDGGGDTGQVVVPPDPLVEAIAVYPADLVVNPTATWQLRAVGTWDDARIDDLAVVDGLTWTSDQPKVVSVNADGVATALTAGIATLTGAVGKISAAVQVEVKDDLILRVTTVDAETGGVISSVKARVDSGDQVEGDKKGAIELVVEDGGAVVLDVYSRDYVPVTIYGIVGREVVVPLHSKATWAGSSVQVSGSVDFSGVPDAAFGENVVGLAVPSLQGGPLMTDPAILFSEDRTVTVYGVEAEVPGNIFLEDYDETYVVNPEPGVPALWFMAGPLETDDVTAGLSGTEDVIELINTNLSTWTWGWDSGVSLAAGESTTLDIAPSLAFDEVVRVAAPELSLGFSGDERPLVLVGEQVDGSGVVVTGMTLGVGETDVQTAADAVGVSTGTIAAAIGQVGGLGQGGAICASWAPVVDGEATLPAFLDVPNMASFDGPTKVFNWVVDTRGALVVAQVEDQDGDVRLVYGATGDVTGILTHPGYTFSYGHTSWTLSTYDVQSDTMEGRFRSGTFTQSALVAVAVGSATVTQKY
jgi:Bacterial Ig-like domain (group 2)